MTFSPQRKRLHVRILHIVVVLTMALWLMPLAVSAAEMDHSSMNMDHGSMEGMDHSSGDMAGMEGMDHGSGDMKGMDHSNMAEDSSGNNSLMLLNIAALLFVVSFVTLRGKRGLKVKRIENEVNNAE